MNRPSKKELMLNARQPLYWAGKISICAALVVTSLGCPPEPHPYPYDEQYPPGQQQPPGSMMQAPIELDRLRGGQLALFEERVELLQDTQRGGYRLLLPVRWAAQEGTRDLKARVRWLGQGGYLIGAQDQQVVLEPGSQRVEVRLGAIGDPRDLLFEFELLEGDDEVPLVHARRDGAMIARPPRLELLTSSYWRPGEQNSLRLLATSAITGEPLEGGTVRADLLLEDGLRHELLRGQLDARGFLQEQLRLSQDLAGRARLEIVVEDRWGRRGHVEKELKLGAPLRTMLTLDKPLYQPGQTIKLRALTLQRGSLEPAADREAELSIYDARDNKLFVKTLRTDAWGIISLEYPLASQLNQGTWRIELGVDGQVHSKQVQVERYRLPRYKLQLQPDQEVYLPGSLARFQIGARYVFGEPVQQADVLIDATLQQGERYQQLEQRALQLSAQGRGAFELQIPAAQAASMRRGEAALWLRATVTDATGEERQIERKLPINDQRALVMVRPAADTLVPGRRNTLLLSLTDLQGRAIAASGTLEIGARRVEVELDESGLGQVEVELERGESTRAVLRLQARDSDLSIEHREQLGVAQASREGAVAIWPRAPIYAVGDRAQIELRALGLEELNVELRREDRLLASDRIELDARGNGLWEVELPEESRGTLRLEAYGSHEDGRLLRSLAMMQVDDPRKLRVDLRAGKEVYRPGEQAEINIEVRDEAGEGRVAAVGLSVVDEAVFALREMRADNARLYFQLHPSLLASVITAAGLRAPQILGEDIEAARREKAARLLFAQAASSDDLGLATISDGVDMARLMPRARQIVQQSTGQLYQALRKTPAETWHLIRTGERSLEAIAAIADPWGEALVFRRDPARTNILLADSAGPDEIHGNEDDLTLERRIPSS